MPFHDEPAQHRPVGDRVAAHVLAVPRAWPDAQLGLRVESRDYAAREPQVRVFVPVGEGAAPLNVRGEGR